jgi:Zn-finger nucleic acid-binding protein
MTDSWDERRKAQEESYFEQANKEALARLARRKDQPARLSPATGAPMEQITLMGVVIDCCPASGGVWLDAGELEQLTHAVGDTETTLHDFVSSLPKGQGAPAVKEHQLSPITGKALETQTIAGVTVGLCQDSKGIWLDGRHLEQLVATSHQTLAGSLKAFIAQVLGK